MEDLLVDDDDEEVEDDEGISSEEDSTGYPSVSPMGDSRIFVVSRVVRSSGGFRPSCLMEGCVCDVRDSSTGPSLHPVSPGSFQLSIRYEPPSPKFSRNKPEFISYR